MVAAAAWELRIPGKEWKKLVVAGEASGLTKEEQASV